MPFPSPPVHRCRRRLQVLLVAELEELQANPRRPARGTVLEASLDKKAGAVCSLLVGTGTLRVGDAVQAGSSFGKVCGVVVVWRAGKLWLLGCGLSDFVVVWIRA